MIPAAKNIKEILNKLLRGRKDKVIKQGDKYIWAGEVENFQVFTQKSVQLSLPEIEDQIIKIGKRIARPGGRITLGDMRSELDKLGISKDQQDEALRSLEHANHIAVYSYDDPQEKHADPDSVAGSLPSSAGHPRHIMYINGYHPLYHASL